jgi:hypothetical protein
MWRPIASSGLEEAALRGDLCCVDERVSAAGEDAGDAVVAELAMTGTLRALRAVRG